MTSNNKTINKFLHLNNEKPLTNEALINANMTSTLLLTSYNSTINYQKRVIEYGVNQHMTGSNFLLHDDTMDVSKYFLLKIQIVLLPKLKLLEFELFNSLTLFDVFVVLDFNINLLSIHKLYKENKCEVVFNKNNCRIQGLYSNGMVENGRAGGLY